MSVSLRLIGFGEDLPPGFDAVGRRQFDLTTPGSIDSLLQLAGIEPAPDLVIMDSDRVIPRTDWPDPLIEDGAQITILSAIEGG